MTEMSNGLARFLAEEVAAADRRFRYLSSYLSSEPPFPAHVLETLQNLRQHAEDDYSNFLHLQSILPPAVSRGQIKTAAPSPPTALLSPADSIVEERGSFVSLTEAADDPSIETGVIAGDDVFMLEGVAEGEESTRSPESATTFSDGDGEESEADEGIHLPRKHSKEAMQVAASLPVGIPWPAELASRNKEVNLPAKRSQRPRRAAPTGDLDEDDDLPSDIAASIQAMARSVHTSSMFGDAVFGDLPRPRLNTLSNI